MSLRSQHALRERLTKQPALLGLMQRYPCATFAELAALRGYDFLMVDEEHGVFTDSDLLQILRTVSFSEMSVVVRLLGHDLQAVGRCLDMGVEGIVVPNVATVEQAHALVRAMTYPPAGTRGLGASAHRATRYGQDIAEHMQSPRGGALLLPIIESAQGVENAERILAVDGVDGAIIGPSDLAADLGCAGNFSDPTYLNALACIEQAAVNQTKILGTAPHPGQPIEALHARGHRLLILGSDTALISEAMNAQLAKAKSAITPGARTT